MENVVDALKIAFAVMMFVMALGLSISSFSQANQAVEAIVKMNDRETEYTYVEPSSELTRIVGIETVVSTMYKAYEENFEIYFFADESGTPLPLYYSTKNDNSGERAKDDAGHDVEVNYVDLESESYGNSEIAKKHLDILLAPSSQNTEPLYEEQFMHTEGLYEYLASFEKGFVEQLGEYYQDYSEDTTSNKNKTKKRVITYTVVP